ncbi:MAG: FHA domain-containing protein, partial [Myxococcota bacterium]
PASPPRVFHTVGVFSPLGGRGGGPPPAPGWGDPCRASSPPRGVDLVQGASARGFAVMDMTVSSYVPWCLRRVFDLDEFPDIHVGRVHMAGNHVVIRSPTISSRQFTVSFEETFGLVVRDEYSSGGTYVDGRQVGEPRALSERERVQVGRMLFRFRRV